MEASVIGVLTVHLLHDVDLAAKRPGAAYAAKRPGRRPDSLRIAAGKLTSVLEVAVRPQCLLARRVDTRGIVTPGGILLDLHLQRLPIGRRPIANNVAVRLRGDIRL